MKCPLCRTNLDELASRRLRDRIQVAFAVVIGISVLISLYALYAYWESRSYDMSHDAVGILPADLAYSVHQDSPEAPGGIVAVYGNISLPSGPGSDDWVYSWVSIYVFDGYNDNRLHIDTGVLHSGESRYFSWAYHFDLLDVSSCEVTYRVNVA